MTKKFDMESFARSIGRTIGISGNRNAPTQQGETILASYKNGTGNVGVAQSGMLTTVKDGNLTPEQQAATMTTSYWFIGILYGLPIYNFYVKILYTLCRGFFSLFFLFFSL